MSATKIASYLKAGWDKFFAGEYSATLPVMSDGERAVAQMDAGGRLRVAGKKHKLVTVALTTTAGAYEAGDCVGGKIAIAGAVRLPDLSGVLKSISVNFKSDNITATFKVALFKADPAASTLADAAAPSVHANDLMKHIGEYALGAQYTDLGAHSSFLLDGINKPIELAGTTLYAALFLATGTPTLGTTSDAEITFAFEQD